MSGIDISIHDANVFKTKFTLIQRIVLITVSLPDSREWRRNIVENGHARARRSVAADHAKAYFMRSGPRQRIHIDDEVKRAGYLTAVVYCPTFKCSAGRGTGYRAIEVKSVNESIHVQNGVVEKENVSRVGVADEVKFEIARSKLNRKLRRPDHIALAIIHARDGDEVSSVGDRTITTLVSGPGNDSIGKISVYHALVDPTGFPTIEDAIGIAVITTHDRQFDVINTGAAIDEDVEPVVGKDLGQQICRCAILVGECGQVEGEDTIFSTDPGIGKQAIRAVTRRQYASGADTARPEEFRDSTTRLQGNHIIAGQIGGIGAEGFHSNFQGGGDDDLGLGNADQGVAEACPECRLVKVGRAQRA